MDKRTCIICAAELPPRARKLCSPECRKAHERERMREWMRDHKERTGTRYSNKYEGKPYVKAAKAERGRRRNQEIPVRTRYPAQFAAKDARRRALIEQATIETFTPTEVYERDGWTCGLCGERVDATLAYPDPMSKSLDHVVPLSKGGDHSMANAQLAHLRCNIAKGARVEADDLARA